MICPLFYCCIFSKFLNKYCFFFYMVIKSYMERYLWVLSLLTRKVSGSRPVVFTCCWWGVLWVFDLMTIYLSIIRYHHLLSWAILSFVLFKIIILSNPNQIWRREIQFIILYLRGGWKRCWECWNLLWSFEYFVPICWLVKELNSCILEIFVRYVGALYSPHEGKYCPRLFCWKMYILFSESFIILI